MFRNTEEFDQILCGDSWINSRASKVEMFDGSKGSIGNEAQCSPTPPTLLTDDNIQAAAQLWATDRSSANATYGTVETWDVSEVTSLENVWCGYDGRCGQELELDAMRKFTGDLSTWNVAEVTNMRGTFWAARSFNGDLSTWNVAKVTTMEWSKLCGLFVSRIVE